MNSYIDAFRKYAVLSGRASIGQYWMFALVHFVVAIGLVVLASIIHDSLIFLYLIYMLAAFVPSIALLVRRVHDWDQSGWIILFGLVPIVGGLIILVFTLIPGTKGENKYGPVPTNKVA